jgi:YfiH family protein
MSTRTGGVSPAPFDALNLGDHVGDALELVQANRATLGRQLGVRPVFLRQVHGTDVLELGLNTPDGASADACFSFQTGVACTIMVADCLPVLMWDVQSRWVAAAHAGWRGLAAGVLENLWAALRARGAQPTQTQVWLGPCIGPKAFEVGPEVRRAFSEDDPQQANAFVPAQGDRWWADLPALARRSLQRLGLENTVGNDGADTFCTVSQPALFFSHRRDAVRLGRTGRMAACIWLRAI